MNTGMTASGIGHAALILWVLVGGFFSTPPDAPAVAVTEVSLVSSAEFDAMVAAAPVRPQSEAPEPAVPTPETPTEPAPETAPEVSSVVPPPRPDALDAPEAPPEAPTAPEPVAEPAPAPDPLPVAHQPQHQGVLDQVGEVPGVEAVAIVHRACVTSDTVQVKRNRARSA